MVDIVFVFIFIMEIFLKSRNTQRVYITNPIYIYVYIYFSSVGEVKTVFAKEFRYFFDITLFFWCSSNSLFIGKKFNDDSVFYIKNPRQTNNKWISINDVWSVRNHRKPYEQMIFVCLVLLTYVVRVGWRMVMVFSVVLWGILATHSVWTQYLL